MSARSDKDKSNEKNIQQLLDNNPTILRKYMRSINNKTSFTRLVYLRHIKHFIDYMENELKYKANRSSNYSKIKPMDITDYMETIRYDENGNEKSISYYNVQLSAIKSFFDFLEDNEIINNNPCKKIKQLKEQKEHEIVTITEEDLDIMINNIENGVGTHRSKARQRKFASRDIALLMLGLTTGLRVSAIVGIDVEDVDLKERCITVVEKGKIERKIYLGIRTIYHLKNWILDRRRLLNYRDDEPALFISRNYKRMSTNAVEDRFRAICKGTGKNITPHKMRATCATRLYEKTGDIYLVQKQLGHKNIENTKRYAKVSEDKMKEAANLLDSLY